MKKKLTISFFVMITLAACNTKEASIYWTDRTDNQIQRLDDANVKYEIREGEIWVREN
ncbi:hypothetical protein M3204_21535 [Mesobacillus subterraneus]|uniref:hypothetical protein n=1 Tax=Mesobacillus subterraneus TaxID=285983 RepID=UPI002041720E|nr:hypothetical protein [Mesobacillus subterraneus]MCM3666988.1 hypothetical protein [Mesobacillus subterraneus]MCM3685819.1 hypothetical protein [Mesobacillus subterraneus]